MSRARLTTSPSGGKSEVLETLRFEGAIRSGVQLRRLSTMVSERYGGDQDREGADGQFLEDVQSIIGELASEGDVTGFDPAADEAVDLSSEQPTTANVILTGQGRATARHPRPRPRYLRG